jgi:hypothetical protein
MFGLRLGEGDPTRRWESKMRQIRLAVLDLSDAARLRPHLPVAAIDDDVADPEAQA